MSYLRVLPTCCQHKDKAFNGFTARYGCAYLVWYEEHETREAAFTRERQIKKWNRAWKLALIERSNPDWIDIASAPQWPLPERAEFSDLREDIIRGFALGR